MPRSILDIVYKLSKQGGADRETLDSLKKVQKGMREVAMVGGSVIASGYAIKKAYDFAKEGAELEMLRTRFDRLSTSIGTTSDALLTDLRTATRGLFSDAELVASATDFMSLGLAKTHDEAVRLAAVSSALNMNMNQLVLTLTNQTTMRFDALGVSVDGFAENLKALEEQGYDTNAAFTEAFLQQAEAQIERVGHAADTTAGSFMQLEAQFKNSGDQAKLAAAEGFAPLIKWMVEGNQRVIDNRNALFAMNKELYQQYVGTSTLTPEMKKLIQEYNHAQEVSAYYTRLLDQQKTATDAVTAATTAQTRSVEDISRANQDMMGLIQQLQSENDRYSESLEELNLKFEDGKYVQDLYKQTKSELLAEARAGTITWEEYNAQVTDLNASYRDGTFAAEQQAAAVDALAKQHEDASKRIAFSLLQQKAAVDGLTQAEFEGLLRVGKQWGLIDEKVVESALVMDEQMSRMGESMVYPLAQTTNLIDKFQNLDKRNGQSWDFFVNIHTSGAFPNSASLTQASNAEQHGIVEDGFAKGGQWRGEFAYVGEQGREMITPSGFIIPHDLTKFLESAGIAPGKGYAFGFDDSSANISYVAAYKERVRRSRVSVPPTVVSKDINNAASGGVSESVVAESAVATEEAVKTSAAAQKQASIEAANTRQAISQGNNELLGQMKELNTNFKKLPRLLTASFQQANP